MSDDSPKLSGAQFGSGAASSARNSVNLYRGQVNLPIPILKLKGRNSLDVKLTAFYQGVATVEATTWNMDSPSGVLGLGWTLPLDQIVASPQSAVALETAQFTLISGGVSRLLIPTGNPHEYATKDYEFWQITFDPSTNCWSVVRENGVRYVYGACASAGYVENLVVWGSWLGSSNAAGGSKFPRAWNLASITNTWGDALSFQYTADEIAVGNAGATYTRACRLSAITDMFGRTATLHYADKVYTEDVQEYQPPHTMPAQANSTVYQDCYETQYLTSIDVTGQDGSPLFSVGIATVLTDFSGTGASGLYKRQLTGVATQYPGCPPEAGLAFSYQSPSAVAPGCLSTVTYPLGAVATYTYGKVGLENAVVSQAISAQEGSPRVWFGSNYVVATFQQQKSSLVIVPYSWQGGWVEGLAQTVSISFALSDLRVVSGNDYFVVYYVGQSSQAATNAWIFVNSPYQPGNWNVSALSSAVSDVALGENCFAVCEAGSNVLIPYQILNGAPVQGPRFSLSGTSVTLAAASHVFPVLGYQANHATVGLLALANGNWAYTPVATLDNLYSPTDCMAEFWSISGTFAVGTFFSNAEKSEFALGVLNWSAGATTPTWTILAQNAVPTQSLPFLDSIAVANIIGNCASVWRWTGTNWDGPASIAALPGAKAPVPQFAYGDDIAIMSTQEGTYFATYDPDAGIWRNAQQTATPPSSADGLPPPTIGTDFATVGADIFFRGAQSDWQNVHGVTLGSAPNLFSVVNCGPSFIIAEDSSAQYSTLTLLQNGTTVVNNSETYFTLPGQRCYVPSSVATGFGLQLAGPGAFVTYAAGDTFTEGGGLRLYRIIDANFTLESAYQSATVVKGVSVNDAVNTLTTFYDYSESSDGTSALAIAGGATYDMNGRIAQFSRVVSMDGVTVTGLAQGNTPPYGSTINYFLNGVGPASSNCYCPDPDQYGNCRNYFGILNGILLYQQLLDSTGQLVSATINRWMVTQLALQGDAATYARQLRNIQLSGMQPAASILGNTGDPEQLDALSVPLSVQNYLTQHNMQLGSLISVLPIDSGRFWLLLDESQDRAFGLTLCNASPIQFDLFVGLRRTLDLTISTSNGMVASSTLTNCDSDGTLWRVTNTNIYLCDVQSALSNATHTLDPVVQHIRCVAPADGSAPPVYTDSNVTLYAAWIDNGLGTGALVPAFSDNWTNAAPAGIAATYTWRGGQTGAPEFNGWTSGAPDVDFWQCQTSVAHRSPHGLATALINIDGVVCSIVYDLLERQPIAQFLNASVADGEAAYYGFESYQANPGWKIGSGEPIVYADDAHTGSQCAEIQANGPALTFSFTRQHAGTSVFSCWIKTAASFGTSDTASWTFTNAATQTPVAADISIQSTGQQWTYVAQVIEVTDALAGQAIGIACNNAAASASILVDDVRVSDYAGGFVGTALNKQGLAVASVSGNGATRYGMFDRAMRPAASAGPRNNGAWNTLSNASASGTSAPPSQLSVTAQTNATYLPFYPDNWQTLCTAASPNDWTVSGGILVYGGANGDVLTFLGTSALANFAVRFQAFPDLAGSDKVQISIGAVTLTLSNQSESLQWTLSELGDTVGAPVYNPRGGQLEWCVVVTGQTVLFLVDGASLFSYTAKQSLSGAVTLSLSTAAFALSDLMVLTDPTLAIGYLSASGQALQTHRLFETGTLVKAIAYDPAGRPAVITKTVPFQFTDPDTPLQYRPSFATMDWATGTLSGDVTDYYSIDDGGDRTNDNGYPFQRRVFDDTPLSNLIAYGLPGSANAITNDSGQGTQYQNAVASTQTPFHGLSVPAAQFMLSLRTDPDGLGQYTLTDKAGAQIAQGAFDADADADNNSTCTSIEYDAASNPTLLRAPNTFTQPSGQGTVDFDTKLTFDATQNVVGSSAIDSGAVSVIRDPAGRIRFLQDAVAESTGTFVYWTYDALGRPIETGAYAGTWEAATLQAYATALPLLSGNAEWPIAGTDGATWRRRYTYDGPLSSRSAGRLYQVQTAASSPGQSGTIYTETFTYLEGGLIDSVSAQYGAYAVDTVNYAYNALGRLVEISPSAGQAVFYSNNLLGQVVSIGSETESELYAAYAYGPSGKIISESRNNGALAIPLTYDSVGKLLAIGSAESLFSEQLGYANRIDGSAGYLDGRISSVAYSYGFASAPAPYSVAYSYDNLWQMTSAVSANAAFDIGADNPLSYDANGNLLTFEFGGNQETYSYTGNQLSAVDGENARTFKYNPSGSLSSDSSKGLSVTYDSVSRLPTSFAGGTIATKAPAAIALEYGASGQRIAKTVADGPAIQYVTGAQTSALIERITASNETTSYQYVYGPRGLLAILGATPWFVMTDHQNSVRLVVDQQENVIAGFDYLPFGAVARSYGSAPDSIRYRYTGQEWDAETALYNFKSRMLDPSIGRFTAPDPAGEFFSPYIYAANNPISFRDPTGAMSIGHIFERIGAIGVGLVEIGIGVVVDVVIDVSTLGAGVALDSIGGTFIGAGAQSIIYTAEDWRGFSWKEYGEQMAIGAATGLVTGGLGSVSGRFATTAGELIGESFNAAAGTAADFGARALAGGALGSIGNFGGTVMANAMAGNNLLDGWRASLEVGAISGLGGAVANGLGERIFGSPADPDPDLHDAARSTSRVLSRCLFGAAAGGALAVGTGVFSNVVSGQKWDNNLIMTAGMGGTLGFLLSLPRQDERLAAQTRCLRETLGLAQLEWTISPKFDPGVEMQNATDWHDNPMSDDG